MKVQERSQSKKQKPDALSFYSEISLVPSMFIDHKMAFFRSLLAKHFDILLATSSSSRNIHQILDIAI